jgi:hypothetical protein
LHRQIINKFNYNNLIFLFIYFSIFGRDPNRNTDSVHVTFTFTLHHTPIIESGKIYGMASFLTLHKFLKNKIQIILGLVRQPFFLIGCHNVSKNKKKPTFLKLLLL